MMNVVIIGSGNVAWAMAKAVAASPKLKLKQIYARNVVEGRRLADETGCALASGTEKLSRADLYIMAVSDMAIAPLSASLNFGAGVLAHTAGSVGIDAISTKVARRAVIYPLQTFSKGRQVDLRTVPLLIEGSSPEALACVKRVAKALSDDVAEMDSVRREMIHLAAVFACNFTNYMYTVAERIAADAGLSFDLLKPLILETALKAVEAPSPRQVQTGPAVRGDFKTKSRHTELLHENPALKNMYVNLSKNIWETLKKT